jgi:hypothetical protein
VLTVDTSDGETLTLRFARLGPDDSPTGYVVTSSARPESFYLAPYQGRPIVDAMAALGPKPKAPPDVPGHPSLTRGARSPRTRGPGA